jgi:cold shock CspA family protein
MTYQSGLGAHTMNSEAGWICILSTREQPDVLKIGMTNRTVAERVREINAATGVLIPFAARQVFRVRDVNNAEKSVHETLGEYRIRSDLEFFKIPFGKAVSVIQEYLRQEHLMHLVRGKVRWYDHEKRHGFVSVEKCEDAFLHGSQVSPEHRSILAEGVIVEFELGQRPQDPCALNVSVVESLRSNV